MLVGEIVQRKEYLKLKISEIKRNLKELADSDIEPQNQGALYSNLLDQLFTMLSKLQSHRALLDQENSSTEIQVGESTISVLDAVHIRRTIKTKIDILTDVMNNINKAIGHADLIDKRDQLMDDYIAVDRKIKESDWSKVVE